jgi:BlaI family transcriptional regulator, penicillinase repressor
VPNIQPTDSELDILAVLWQRGPSTVRQVFDEIARAKPTGYTTVLKLMQIMHAKKLVVRDEREKTHIYRPAHSETAMHKSLMTDLLGRAFGGSKQKLLLSALQATRATAQDLAEISKIIDAARAAKSDAKSDGKKH